MNSMILHSLFLDNPDLAEAVYRFCNADPLYHQSELDYEQAAQKLQDAVGFPFYSEYETKLNAHMARVERACYLFGLGLREEVLRGLGVEC